MSVVASPTERTKGQRLSLNYRGKRVLLTGSTGYLGYNLGQSLRDLGAEVTPLFSEHLVKPEVWKGLLPGMDLVFHLAAQTDIEKAEKDIKKDYAANVLPLQYLLEACEELKCRPAIIFSGTVTQIGMPQYLPVDEFHPDDPITVYDKHKLMAEQMLHFYSRRIGVRGVSLRLANVYGPGPKSQGVSRGILNAAMDVALRGETLYYLGAGEEMRDFIYIDDVMQAFLLAGLQAERLAGQSFVIGSEKGTTFRQAFELVAKCVETVTGKKVSVASQSAEEQHPIHSRSFIAKSSLFSQATGWYPKWLLKDGILQTLRESL